MIGRLFDLARPKRHDKTPAAPPLLAARADEELAATATPLPHPETAPSLTQLEEQAEEAALELSAYHERWIKQDLARLYSAWDAVKAGGADLPERQELFVAAHNLKGMAETYGHPAIARLCGSLTRLLEDGAGFDRAALVNLHIEACKAAYTEGRETGGATTLAKTVCVALEAQVERAVSA